MPTGFTAHLNCSRFEPKKPKTLRSCSGLASAVEFITVMYDIPRRLLAEMEPDHHSLRGLCSIARPILHVIRANQHGNAMALPTQNHLKREAEEEWRKRNGDHAIGENPIMIRREQDGR